MWWTSSRLTPGCMTSWADKLENVSSWHHQAVTDVAADGTDRGGQATVDGLDIVEAVENQSKTFCLGVQFHPENDAKLALHDNKPEEAKCDPDVCLTFFQYLVSYASGKRSSASPGRRSCGLHRYSGHHPERRRRGHPCAADHRL